MCGFSDTDNIDTRFHLYGMRNCEIALLYRLTIYGVNGITERVRRHIGNLYHQPSILCIHLIFFRIVLLRGIYPCGKLVRLDDIGEVAPSKCLSVFLSRTDGNIDRYIVGGKAMKRTFSRVDTRRMFCTNRRRL